MKKNETLTWGDIKAMYAETDKRFKETEKILKETSLLQKETALQMKENERKMAKSKKETDRQMKKDNEELKKILKETSLKVKETSLKVKELRRNIGGISNSNGEVAEQYFYNAFKRSKTFGNEKFDKIRKNMAFKKEDLEAEFDIVLFNGKSAALIEVKYNAKPDNISVRRIITRVDAFKLLYPEYSHHSIYLGVAAFSFRKGLEERLHRAGIATIRQVGKKLVVYDKEMKVF